MEKARELHGTVAAGRDFLAEIFPELAESEDERIRKELMDIIEKSYIYGGFTLNSKKDLDRYLAWLEKQKGKMTAEEFQLKLKEAKENKYIRAQLLWELMHSGIITEVDYQYLTDDKRKPWTVEEYRIAYQEGFEMSEQLKQKESLHIQETCKEKSDSFTDEDERIRRTLAEYFGPQVQLDFVRGVRIQKIRDWLEKQKDASKAIEAVDRIDKYIDEHLANAHDMKDSNPDKKYYRGWDDALGKMAGILQDVYSEKENK